MSQDVFAVVSEQNPKFKPVNQDCAFAGPITNRVNIRMHVVAVADGISGASHGEKASLMAVTSFCEFLAKSSVTSAHELAEKAYTFFTEVNEEISEIGDGGSGTTFTAMVLFKKRGILLHIGDSRAYFIANGNCQLLTDDHTEVAVARKQGVDEEEIAKMHQHALAQCLGIDAECEPDIIVSPIPLGKEEGILVLTTDGVHDVISNSQMITLAEESELLKSFCKKIVQNALVTPTSIGKPNKDNITLAIVRVPKIIKKNDDNGLLLPVNEEQPPSRLPLFVIIVLVFLFTCLSVAGYYFFASKNDSAEVSLNSSNKVSPQPVPAYTMSEIPKARLPIFSGDNSSAELIKSIEIIDQPDKDFSITLICNAIPKLSPLSRVESQNDTYRTGGQYKIYYDIAGITSVSTEAEGKLTATSINNFPGLTSIELNHHKEENSLRIVIRGSDEKILNSVNDSKTGSSLTIRFAR